MGEFNGCLPGGSFLGRVEVAMFFPAAVREFEDRWQLLQRAVDRSGREVFSELETAKESYVDFVLVKVVSGNVVCRAAGAIYQKANGSMERIFTPDSIANVSDVNFGDDVERLMAVLTGKGVNSEREQRFDYLALPGYPRNLRSLEMATQLANRLLLARWS